MSIEALKEQARNHELKEEWTKALGAYTQALDRATDTEQPDIPLLNRVGDLLIRTGEVDEAVRRYEEAIDLYVETELPNNAIAICKKILRNVPQRAAVHLRMGQIRAGQGFLRDARQHFLFYAEEMQSKGKTEDALSALVEFANLAPDDAEIQVLLASHLHSQGREDEALLKLQSTYQRLKAGGDHEGALPVEEKLRELAPDQPLPEVIPGVFPAHSDHEEAPAYGGLELETTSLAGDGDGGDFGEVALTEPADTPEPTSDTLEPTALPEPVAGGMEDWGDLSFEISSDEDQEGAHDEAEDEPQEEVVPSPDDSAASSDNLLDMDFGEFGDLDTLGLDEAPQGDEVLEDTDESEVAAHEDDDEDLGFGDLPTFSFEDDDEEDADVGDPLPTLELDPEPPEPVTDSPEGIPEPEPALPEEAIPEPEPALPEEAIPEPEPALPEEALPEPEDDLPSFPEPADPEPAVALGHEELAAAGRVEDAIRVVDEALASEPDSIPLLQRKVEYSYRLGGSEPLVVAFLQLGSVLDAQGQREKARAVYQQVLAMDPRNDAARAGMEGEPAPAMPSTETPPEKTSGDGGDGAFVDLGSMILEPEAEEGTTRWVMEEEEPTGDENLDFARMLKEFKSRVARNLPRDDAKAHYDLGTAYKEMGLLDEAVGEFQAAIRASGDTLPTLEMLGQCFLEQGQAQVAVRTLERALKLPFQVEDELLGIYYYMGRAHEESGNTQGAREFYEKVFSLDINFQDVTERLRSLRSV
ncbi:MAG: tetratricopeptide repeat protein [Gemmatimonadota bacterium]